MTGHTFHIYVDDTPRYWDDFWTSDRGILGKRIDSAINPDLISRSAFTDSIAL